MLSLNFKGTLTEEELAIKEKSDKVWSWFRLFNILGLLSLGVSILLFILMRSSLPVGAVVSRVYTFFIFAAAFLLVVSVLLQNYFRKLQKHLLVEEGV